MPLDTKQKINRSIISPQPIRRRSPANSFREFSMNSVSINVRILAGNEKRIGQDCLNWFNWLKLNHHIVLLFSYIHCVFHSCFFLCISCKEHSLIWDLNQERSKRFELLICQNRSYDTTSSLEYTKSTRGDMSQVWINGIDKLTRIVTLSSEVILNTHHWGLY